jgi:hypothetical protein
MFNGFCWSLKYKKSNKRNRPGKDGNSDPGKKLTEYQ